MKIIENQCNTNWRVENYDDHAARLCLGHVWSTLLLHVILVDYHNKMCTNRGLQLDVTFTVLRIYICYI